MGRLAGGPPFCVLWAGAAVAVSPAHHAGIQGFRGGEHATLRVSANVVQFIHTGLAVTAGTKVITL